MKINTKTAAIAAADSLILESVEAMRKAFVDNCGGPFGAERCMALCGKWCELEEKCRADGSEKARRQAWMYHFAALGAIVVAREILRLDTQDMFIQC